MSSKSLFLVTSGGLSSLPKLNRFPAEDGFKVPAYNVTALANLSCSNTTKSGL